MARNAPVGAFINHRGARKIYHSLIAQNETDAFSEKSSNLSTKRMTKCPRVVTVKNTSFARNQSSVEP